MSKRPRIVANPSARRVEQHVSHPAEEGGAMINHTAIKILKYKAGSLKNSPEYSAYVKKVLKEFEIQDAKEAFILGAVDAMVNGAALSMNSSGSLKKSILKAILKK